MSEEVEPRLEQFMREAFAREDVHRFKQVLREVAGRVEKEEVGSGGGRVIPIQRPTRWITWAAAASVALVVTFALWQWGGTGGLHQDTLAQLNMDHGFEFSGTRSGATDELDEQLNKVRRSGQLDEYLRQSERALTNDTAFAARFNDPVRLDRAIVWLRLNNPAKALQELTALRDPRRWEKCEAAIVRGLEAALRNDPHLMRAEFAKADGAGCLSEELKRLAK